MGGFKKRLNESIQFKLSFSLSLAILVIAVLAGSFSFVSAFDEAHELQDDMLRQVAALLTAMRSCELKIRGQAFKPQSDSGCLTRSIAHWGVIKLDQVWVLPSSRQPLTGLARRFSYRSQTK